MTEIIGLCAKKDVYRRYFDKPWFSAPDGQMLAQPGDKVQIISMVAGDILAQQATWGFQPYWRWMGGKPAHYAAGETITRKWMFATSFKSSRCIVPATSFTYTTESNGVEMRYELTPAKGELLLLGGIYEAVAPYFGAPSPSVALITTRPNQLVERYAQQMPMILTNGQINAWIRKDTDVDSLLSFIEPAAFDQLKLTISARPIEKINNWVTAKLQLA